MKPLAAPLAALSRLAAALLSPAGRRASLLVLTYHRVVPARDPMNPADPDAAEFASQMELVAGLCKVLSLREAAERLASGSLPARAACLTFDDGYSNNRTVAAPILARLGLTGTFFVTTGFLNGGRMWNDTVIEAVRAAGATLDLSAQGLGVHRLGSEAERAAVAAGLLSQLKYLEPGLRLRRADQIAAAAGAALPTAMMLTDREVGELAGLGMEIGAHSVSHPILATLEDAEAQREIAECRARLEAIVRQPVTSFAYPNGRPGKDYGARHVAMVRAAGYRAAVSTAWGAARAGSDLLQLPRIAPWDRTAARFVLRLLRARLGPPPAVA